MTNNIQGNSHQAPQQKLYKPEGNGMIYLKRRKGIIYKQQYSTQQDSPSDLMEKSNLSRQTKVKRIQHHQTSFTTNAKGTSLEKKHKRRKRATENKVKIIKKMVKGSYISITNLNVNGLNFKYTNQTR